MKILSGCAGCYAGLSCDVRIKIINLLEEKGEQSVLEIAKHFKVKQPTISHHLKYLRDAGILSSKKKGKKVFYLVDPKCKGKCKLFV